MTDPLRDRLRNLEGLLKSGKGAVLRGRELSGKRERRAGEEEAWAQSLGGREVIRPEGAFLFFQRRYPWDAHWGGVPLARMTETVLAELPLLSPSESLVPSSLEEIAFVDIESTGLFGGTGTYAFLVAVGGIESDGFVVRQYFMRDFHEESAQLAALEEGLEGCTCLCSFNGRAFDIPFLSSRFITQRKRFAAAAWPHFDVLFPARRLWKARLGDCSLQNLEAEILGMVREDDIPGELIPRVYFNFVRGRELDEMSRVIEHNQRDVVTTAMLLAHLSRVRQLAGELEHAADLAALARWMDARREHELAVRSYLRVLGTERLERKLWWECHRSLSLLYKRGGQWDEATALWEAMAHAGRRADLFPYEELAKFYEHRARQPQRALETVERFLKLLEFASGLGRAPEVDMAALERRRARLLRKLAGQATAEDTLLTER